MEKTKVIYLGGGCFWCTEAVFQVLQGVLRVRPGYMGGSVPNPTYQQVCTGQTGHAEVVEVVYDTRMISTDDLLDIFFHMHDPTTLNRQGADVGTQYRSVIFYTDEATRISALKCIRQLTRQNVFNRLIVTEVQPATAFFPAEAYHMNYYNTHRKAPYCTLVIEPKLMKLKERFAHRVTAELPGS